MEPNYHQFIVAGASTAGKSTFSHELVKKFQVMHIPIDPVIEGFEDVFPELGITHNALTHDDHVVVCQKFLPFISRVVRHHQQAGGLMSRTAPRAVV
jgi:adenylate kinase family enzyme